MTGSSEHWPTWAMLFPIRRWDIQRHYGIAPAPKRSQTTTWKQFIAAHMSVLAGIDFFTVEVLTWRGLATYYVCSSFIWRRGVSLWAASPDIPPRPGWSKWLATRSMKLP